MNNYLIIGIALVGASLIAAVAYRYIKKRREEEIIAENIARITPHPHVYKGTTLFLTKTEIEHFESMGDDVKKKTINSFKAGIKKGKYIPVYEQGSLSGYVKKY